MNHSTRLRRIKRDARKGVPKTKLNSAAGQLLAVSMESLRKKGIKNPGKLTIANEAHRIVELAKKNPSKKRTK